MGKLGRHLKNIISGLFFTGISLLAADNLFSQTVADTASGNGHKVNIEQNDTNKVRTDSLGLEWQEKWIPPLKDEQNDTGKVRTDGSGGGQSGTGMQEGYNVLPSRNEMDCKMKLYKKEIAVKTKEFAKQKQGILNSAREKAFREMSGKSRMRA